jgi:hypothetical protein
VSGTFRRDGADPGPLPGLPRSAAERFELLNTADFPDLRHIVNGRMVPVTDPLAQAKRLVEVRLNATTYGFIRARGLYTVDGQRRAIAQGAVEFPEGSMQLKAGWRPITRAERSRYHTLTVRLANGSTRLFGLAALNIATKTASGWLWASFEHTDADVAGRHYRLVGTQTTYLEAGLPVRLGNAVLEGDLEDSASCMTCHARATLSTEGTPRRLPVFAPAAPGVRRGYTGTPDPAWFGHADAQGQWRLTFAALDFVWSLSQAAAHGPAAAVTPGGPP